MGRELHIVPLEVAKRNAGVRLSDEGLERLGRLALLLQTSRNDLVEMALRHLEATLNRGEGVYLTLPPSPQDDHKTA